MKFCTQCGTSLSDDSRFCGKCGAPSKENEGEASSKLQWNLNPKQWTLEKPTGHVSRSGITVLPYLLRKWKIALYVSLGLWFLATCTTMIQSFSAANEFDASRTMADEYKAFLIAESSANWESISLGLWAISGILFLCFLWRATKNLISAGIVTKRGAGWSVGGWFIPIGWFWIPYQTVKELIETRPNVSDPYGPDDLSNKTKGYVRFWLGIWIASWATRIFSRVYTDALLENAKFEDLGRMWDFVGFVYLIHAVLIVAYFIIISAISERQENKRI